MGKSLRSTRVKQNKTLKRQSVFGEVQEARELRVREHLHKAALEKLQEQKAAQPEDAGDGMEVDTSKPKKATGGWSKKKKEKKRGKSKKIRKH